MTNPFTNIDVNSITIYKDYTTFVDNDAVTKSYVDTKFTDLIDAAPGALDTLNELAAALNNDASFSATVTNNIATETTARTAADAVLQTNIDNEETARTNADITLQSNIDSEAAQRLLADNNEATARVDADTALQGNIDSEETARLAADQLLQSNIDSEELSRINADNILQQNIDNENNSRLVSENFLNEKKVDKSNNYRKRTDGNFNIEEIAYLYIGNHWRIAASNIDTEKRLMFEFTEDGEYWYTGTPYIRSTPSINTTLNDIIPNTGVSRVNIYTIFKSGIDLYLTIDGDNIPRYTDIDSVNIPEEEMVFNIEYVDDRVYNISNSVYENFSSRWYNSDNILETVPIPNIFTLTNITFISPYSFRSHIKINNQYLGYGNSINEEYYSNSVLTSSEYALEFYFIII